MLEIFLQLCVDSRKIWKLSVTQARWCLVARAAGRCVLSWLLLLLRAAAWLCPLFVDVRFIARAMFVADAFATNVDVGKAKKVWGN